MQNICNLKISGNPPHRMCLVLNLVLIFFLDHFQQVLFCMCAGNELFYAMIYLLYFTEGPSCKLCNVFDSGICLVSYFLWRHTWVLMGPRLNQMFKQGENFGENLRINSCKDSPEQSYNYKNLSRFLQTSEQSFKSLDRFLQTSEQS